MAESRPVVISGMSGRFPQSDNLSELWANLVSGSDLITSGIRGPQPFFDASQRSGKLKSLSDFDAEFFGINSAQANSMPPMSRILLEVVYEALADSGYCPSTLRGSRTGVYFGYMVRDVDDAHSNRTPEDSNWISFTGFGYANTLSYHLDFKGPSVTLEAACSSSMSCLSMAINDIKSGQCDRAIVAAGNIIVNTSNTQWINAHRALSKTGMSRHLDIDADGYVRSEAVAAIVVEPLDLARRNYGEVVAVVSGHDGHNIDGIFAPSLDEQTKLLERVYGDLDSGVKVKDIAYVEAHGTGTARGDFVEATAIGKVLAVNRTVQNPLRIGSVKSNLGHTEAVAGVMSLIKVILATEHAVIPANINLRIVNPLIDCIKTGIVMAVNENTNFDGGIIAINSFGMGGTNAHCVLRTSTLPIQIGNVNLSIPRLICFHGRDEQSVNNVFDQVTEFFKANQLSEDFLALVNCYSTTATISGLNIRGVLTIGSNAKFSREVRKCSSQRRPLVLVFSGIGSQWSSMAKELMLIPVIKNSIEQSHEVLAPFGVDLIQIVTSTDSQIIKDVIASFVAIVATQIALVDLLKFLDLEPDHLVGFSIGEAACAYFDCSLSRSQVLKVAFWRAKSAVDANLSKGAMAAIGISVEQCSKRCPPNVVVACHLSKDMVTISGPFDDVEEFKNELQNEGVFCRLVDSNGHANHHPRLSAIQEQFTNELRSSIPTPQLRTSKWISSSIDFDDEEQCSREDLQHASIEYFANNLVNPVRFHEALDKCAQNSIVIEVGPHSTMAGSVKKTLKDSDYVSMMEKNNSRSVSKLFSALGELYNLGLCPATQKLYPNVQFPVAKGTKSISNLIKWRREEQFAFDHYPKQFNMKNNCDWHVDIDLNSSKHNYLAGHRLDGVILFPALGFLELAWKALARLNCVDFERLPVEFLDVHFERALLLYHDRKSSVTVKLNELDHSFVIYENEQILCRGNVRRCSDANLAIGGIQNALTTTITSNDVYKELRVRGYHYSGEFRQLDLVTRDLKTASLNWTGHWASFLDNCLQLIVLAVKSRQLMVPVAIKKLTLNPELRHSQHNLNPEDVKFELQHDLENCNIVIADMVSMEDVKFSSVARNLNRNLVEVHERVTFMANEDEKAIDSATINLIAEFEEFNSNREDGHQLETWTLSSISLNCEQFMKPVLDLVLENSGNCFLIDCEPQLESTLKPILSKYKFDKASTGRELDLLIVACHLNQRTGFTTESLMTRIKVGGFMLIVIKSRFTNCELSCIPNSIHGVLDFNQILEENPILKNFVQVANKFDSISTRLVLVRNVTQDEVNNKSKLIRTSMMDLSWVESANKRIKEFDEDSSKARLWFLGLDDVSGVHGLVNCLHREPNLSRFTRGLLAINEEPSPSDLEKVQRMDLVQNVLRNGKFGQLVRQKLDLSAKLVNCDNVAIFIGTLGDLNSVNLRKSPENIELDARTANSNLIDVHYVGLNTRDLMIALNQLESVDGRRFLCNEFSGTVRRSEHCELRRVMGFQMSKSVSSTMTQLSDCLVWTVPKTMTMEEAATIPIAYLTAIYGLIHRARLQGSESVLINSAFGAVGQAAIRIAQSLKSLVYVTCSSQSEREFLKTEFGLTDDHIFDWLNSSFVSDIKHTTQFRGVDVILNSSEGDLLIASLNCMAVNGRFVETGEADALLEAIKNTKTGLRNLLRNGSLININIDEMCSRPTEHSKQLLESLLQGFLDKEVVKPIKVTSFDSSELKAAFQSLSSASSIGKVVIRLRDESSKLLNTPALDTVQLSEKKCYVVIGGMGGYGLELLGWLIARGAQTLLVTSRSTSRTAHQKFRLEQFKKSGANVVITPLDVSDYNQASELIALGRSLSPQGIGGIFNLAMVLKDGLFDGLRSEDFEAVFMAKVYGTINLDKVLTSMNIYVDWFVCFSSISCGHGNAGQSNYGMANSSMERLVELRRSRGLHGLAIQWGAIGDVGVMAEESMSVDGYEPQSIESCLHDLELLMLGDDPIVSSFRTSTGSESSLSGVPVTLDKQAAAIMGRKDFEDVALDKTLSSLGLNSLTVVEMKQLLDSHNKKFKVDVIKSLTVKELLSLIDGS